MKMEMNQEQNFREVVVLKPKDLTKSAQSVSKKEIAKYLSKDYINWKLQNINDAKENMLIRFLWMS
jgi:hypothetical protein